MSESRLSLETAVKENDLSKAEALLASIKEGPSDEKYNQQLYRLAIKNNSHKMLHLLLSNLNPTKNLNEIINTTKINSFSLLSNGVLANKFEIVNYLLTNGAMVDVKETVTNNEKTYSNITPLIFASEKGYAPIAQLLLDHGADINHIDSTGATPLVVAISNNEEKKISEVTSILIENSKVNVKIGVDDGQTALFLAAKKGNFDVVKRLCELKADVNQGSTLPNISNITPLSIAIDNKEFKIVDYLLRMGADINKLDSANNAPIHVAAQYSEEGLLDRLLQESGLNVDVKDENNRSALDIAIEKKLFINARRLIKAGATMLKPEGDDEVLNNLWLFYKSIHDTNIEIPPVDIISLDSVLVKETYFKETHNFITAFAECLNQVLPPPNPSFTAETREEVINFYAQVLNYFANPGSPEINAVFKQLEEEIKTYLKKANPSVLNKQYQNVQYGEQFSLCFPLSRIEMLEPLEAEQCLTHVFLEKFQKEGLLNQTDDPKVHPIPYYAGIVPTVIGQESLKKGDFFRDISIPDTDASIHGIWTHYLQFYIIISLVRMNHIKINSKLSVAELLKMTGMELAKKMEGVNNLFDFCFERRLQFKLIEKNDKTIAFKDFPKYEDQSFISPYFLNSYISVMQSLKICDAPTLTLLWLHHTTKMNYRTAKRNGNVNDSDLKNNPKFVEKILNSKSAFFVNAPSISMNNIEEAAGVKGKFKVKVKVEEKEENYAVLYKIKK